MAARDPWFDNAKMALVTLAVVGHAWSVLPDTATSGSTSSWLYDWLYVWHMPAFVLVSGYLSRSFDWTPSRCRSLVTTIVVPLVLVQVALAGFQQLIGWGAPEEPLLQPLWPLWYLVALVCWRLAAPVFRRLPVALALPGAVAISLLGGTIDVSYFSLSKVMGFLPFFVLGLVATPEWVRAVRTPPVRLVGLGFLGATLWIARDLDAWAGTWWLYQRPYELLGATATEGMAVRAVLLVLGLGCSLGALALVPRTEGWFTRMGSATMVVLLVHGFVVRAVNAAGLLDWTVGHEALGRLVVLGAAVGLSLALASRPSVRAFGPWVDPVGWLREETRRAVHLTLDAGAHERRSERTGGDRDRVLV